MGDRLGIRNAVDILQSKNLHCQTLGNPSLLWIGQITKAYLKFKRDIEVEIGQSRCLNDQANKA